MKRIIYIILLAMGLAAVVPMASLVDNNVAAVYAADARAKAKAQREKEKAKLLKAREKAKAKAAKEREKKKKEQAKAAAQKQKAREKAKAQQAKAKQSSASNKQVASKATAPKVYNSLSAAEEKAQYMEQIAAIDKANAKAEAYNNRDITHRLGFWGQVGYSNLFTSGIAFDDKAQTGFQNKDKGFVGGGLGLGYQLRYKQFLMTVGAEFNTYNSIMGVSNQPDGSVLRSFGMEPYATTMTYTYNFAKMQDQLIGGFAQLPLLFGMELKKLPLFWQAGLKAGIGVWSSSKISGTVTTVIHDEQLIEGLTEMYNHALVTDEDFSRPATSVKWGLNLAATAEIGVNFDQWINASPRLRLSLFADYGFLNALSYKAAAPVSAKAQTDLPAQLLATANPLDFPTNSALATSSAANAKVNPFLVGAKIAVWFDLPRPKKYTRDYPKKPTPRMGVYMFDENSALALGGVAVQITNTESGKQMQKNTNRQGLLQGRFAPGEYRISATKNGYFPSDTVLQSVEEFTFDTLRLPLRRIPAPIIYTLCMNVYDEESHEPVEAAARLTALTDTVVLYAAQASDDGFIETPLTEGDYIAHFTAAGYMPKDDTIHFVRDTADIFLRHIKEGIKVKIENLFFATNKTVILPTSEQSMSDLASFLLQNPSVTIHITGHTDAVGSDEANQILSEGRANAVRADLIKRGVAPERMTAEGKGEREHVADNDTEEGRQLNRRVEFTITGTGDEDIQQVF